MEASIYVGGAFSAQIIPWYLDCATITCIIGVGIVDSLGILIISALIVVRDTILSLCSDNSVRKKRVDLLNIIWIEFFESVRGLLLVSRLSVVVLIGLFGLQDFRNIIVT